MTYFLLQTARLSSTDVSYSLLNLIGAALIALSLLFDFNLSAFIIEIAWMAISVYGIIRYARDRTRPLLVERTPLGPLSYRIIHSG